jgi:outer membrane protein assembly factor BamB
MAQCFINSRGKTRARVAVRLVADSILLGLCAVVAGCGPAPAKSDGIEPPASNERAKKQPDTFRDPAPPAVRPIEPMEPPAARPHPRVRNYGPPKPLLADAVTHDWTSFLGPTHNAASSETKLLKEWPEGGPAAVWELKKGTGYTSPAILGDRLVYFHRIGDEGVVECLNAENGSLYWEFRYPTQFEDRFGYNNGPRASPVIDADHVYIYGAEGRLFCLMLHTGQLVWTRDLSAEFRVPQDFFGVTCTPLVEGDRLIINLGAPGGPCVVAIDKNNGALVWGAGTKWGPSYASPVPAVLHGQRRVLVFAGGESRPPTGGLICLDPTNGKIDFEFPWRSHVYESVNASCPVVVDDTVFVSANYFTGSALVKIHPDFTHEPLWTNKSLGTHWMTAVHNDGHFYGFDGHFEDDSAFVCVDASDGKTKWRHEPQWEDVMVIRGQERRGTMGTFRACLLQVDGSFLCLGERGHLLWMDLSPDGFEIKQRAWLFQARETWALPVLSRGLLYVCQNSPGIINRESPRLLCYDLRAE